MDRKKIILFDIDYTLFNTTLYKQVVAKELAKRVDALDVKNAFQSIEKVYYDVRKFGSFNPKKFASLFSKKFPSQISEKEIEEIWFQEKLLSEAVYPETMQTLKKLQSNQNLILGIFSSGMTEFQLAKISGLEDFFHKDHIHITSFKEETLDELVQEYKDEDITLVDDFIDILKGATDLKRDITAVWMKRGRFAEKAFIPTGFEPNAIITKLDELLPIVDSERE